MRKIKSNNWVKSTISIALLAVCIIASAGSVKKTSGKNPSAYLFVYFTGNHIKEEAIRFGLSTDGYNFKALNKNRPVLKSADISLSGGVRDPHILRGVDGKTFYMVATDMVSANGWNSNRGIVLLKSNDLIHWTSKAIHFPTIFSENFGNVLRVWAPQTIYDPEAKKYMIYFSILKDGSNEYDKIYYCYANKNFDALETEPKQLFFAPDGKSCIDGDIVFANGKYHLFYKTEGHGNGIKKATADKLTGTWVAGDKYLQQTTRPVEGAGVFKLNNSTDWILMYDMYTSGTYEFTHSSDLENFKVVDKQINLDFQPRHGTVLPITTDEANRLKKQWTKPSEIFRTAKANGLRTINIVVNDSTKHITFPVEKNTNLNTFKPVFETPDWVKLQSSGSFKNGSMRYKLKIGSGTYEYNASIVKNGNPVMSGLYADPEILYSEKTGKYYIYPTSDGYNNWEGTSFSVFSSTDLTTWKDEGVILQLGKDVSWAKYKAWAPCIIERKVNNQYKYFFYFCAEQKIGVAVSDNPTGPFTDTGKPMIEQHYAAISKKGQLIDPDVFKDPQSGKYYFYWGNGFMAGAELNDDMTSIKEETISELTPPNYTEGTYVFYRNGLYYFMWSQNDTRDPNYKVRYGYSKSPLDKLTIPENNVVLEKDVTKGIFATGHNSVIQIPGKDEWYIVYHRFNYPNGINMGRSAGYNREVCIDKLEFNADGTIKQTIPTHSGIVK